MREITLSQGKYAIVDNEDYVWLSKWKWYYHHTGYAVRTVKKKMILMHREINNTPSKYDTDHCDGNKLNNRRYNLRNSTRSQNIFNTPKSKNCSSIYKGVSWEKNRNKWSAHITKNGNLMYLGQYVSEINAAQAYNFAAIKYFGEFAVMNISNTF